MPPTPLQGRIAALCRALPAIVLLTLSVVTLTPALLPAGATASCLRLLGAGELARRYTDTIHAQFVPRLRSVGVGFLLMGLVAWRFRRPMAWLMVEGVRRALADLRGLRPRLQALPTDRATWASLLAVTALALTLRLPFLFQPMRYDESFTYSAYASRPAHVIVSTYDYPNNHIFHSLCVRASCGLLGDEPWAIRLPALLVGVLLAPTCYVVARLLYGPATALLASCLVAFSSPLIEYATNARGYGLVAWCFLLLIGLGCWVLREKNVFGWGLWTVVAALGFWTVPTMLFPFGAVVLWLAVSAGDETRSVYGGRFYRYLLAFAGLALALTAVLYLPVVLLARGGGLLGNRFVAPLEWSRWREALPATLASTWQQWNRDVPAPVGLVLVAGFLVAVIGRGGRLAALTVLWCATLAAVQRVAPPERVWLFALPLYLLVACAGLETLARLCRPLGLGELPASLLAASLVLVLGVQALWSGSVPSSTETGTLRDAGGVTEFLAGQLEPDDRILAACPSDAPLQYYFVRRGLPVRHLIAGTELKDWTGSRLLVVVNRTHGQTLETLAERYGLANVVDLENARLLRTFETAEVYELEGRQAAVSARTP